MGVLCCFEDGLNQSLVSPVVQARFFLLVIFMTDLKSSTFSGVTGTELKPVLLLNSFNTSTSLLRIWRKKRNSEFKIQNTDGSENIIFTVILGSC